MPLEVFVARQPIFDRALRLYGYELLFRSTSAKNEFDPAQADTASEQVLANTLLSIGFETVAGGVHAFVNFDRRMLLGDWHSVLPKASCVIEILETVEPDRDVLEACRKLRQQGYRIALDDYACDSHCDELLRVANLIKLEIRSCSWERQKDMISFCKRRGMQILAEKVETQEEYERCLKLGYDFFQGYFFARPVIVRGRQIPTAKQNCLQLLAEAQQPEMDFELITRIVESDVSFSYKLLRYVNSALFTHRNEITSIRQALLMVGEDNLRRWIALAALTRAAENKPLELSTQSLVRAKFCESLSRLGGVTGEQPAFLTGLFSLLDALIDVPLAEALSEVRLEKSISSVLLGQSRDDDPLAQIYALTLAYEAAAWDRVDLLSRGTRVDPGAVGQAYFESVRWVQDLATAIQ